MAGGLAFDTPMGRLYSTNITPDQKTGIGEYTLARVEGALRRGVKADGGNFYPTMPYPSFAGCGANIGSRAKQEFWGLMWITRQALHSKFQVRFCF